LSWLSPTFRDVVCPGMSGGVVIMMFVIMMFVSA